MIKIRCPLLVYFFGNLWLMSVAEAVFPLSNPSISILLVILQV